MNQGSEYLPIFGLLVIVVGVFLGVSGMGVATSNPLVSGTSASDSSPSCDYLSTHNTARLRATPDAVVDAGSHLNGTGGSVWFEGLPGIGSLGADQYLLRGPGGIEVGPRHPISQGVIFHEVPLCATGTWELVEDGTGETQSRFRTTLDKTQAGPSTIVLDQATETDHADEYFTGYADGGYVAYTGDTVYESGGPAESQTVRVFVNWTSEVGAHEPTDRAVLSILAEGEDGGQVTTLELPDFGNGTLSVYPTWGTPSVNDVEVNVWAYDDGDVWRHSPAEVTVVVAPEAG